MDNPLVKLSEQNDKTKALKALLLELKKTDKAEDSVIAQRSGSFIVAVFSTAITIAGFSVMPPVIGGALIGACVASAGGTIIALASDVLKKQGGSNRELLAVLSSKEVKQWVKLWELSSDTELFLSALEYACQGELIEINGKEVFRHDDGRHPFDVAHNWILSGIETKPAADKLAIAPQPQQLSEEPKSDSLSFDPASPANTEIAPLVSGKPRLSDLKLMPLDERAIALLKLLEDEHFNLSHCIQEQITCICGNQRGGKGTLMAILAILSRAIDPGTKIHYFTAGDDIYPFNCDRLVCRLSYPDLDGDRADACVAQQLFSYLKEMDRQTQGTCKDIILVIDEAVALSDYLDPDQKQWMIRFLLTRANKKGAQIFIVLHGINLTSWVGTGNAGGFSQTFKTGATFIGCEATSKKIHPLRSISVATGHYFLASPDDFSKPLPDGELGTLPDWMKSEINPSTGQPDPARTLLNFFPELRNDATIDATIASYSNASSISKTQPTLIIDKEITDNASVTELKVSDALSEPLKTIWFFAKEKNDWVTAKEIYQKSYSVLKGKGVKEIHQLLGLLADTGYGEIDEEGKSDSAVAFKAY